MSRALALLLLTAWLTGCRQGASVPFEENWRTYRDWFVAPDGRVIDTGNGGISHSEGQGYGMLMAVFAGDREGFDRIWAWTQTHLQVRGDRLFMWRRRPGEPLEQEDRNDAADGDIVIAWALLRAGEKWRQPPLTEAAQGILKDIRDQLIRPWRDLTILLPGASGFEREGGFTVNPSYWVFPAFREFQRWDASPVWEELRVSGRRLLQSARFGRWHLPADWLDLGDSVQLAAQFKPLFGYEAIRIPIYALWDGADDSLLGMFDLFWEAYGTFTPAWIHLTENCMDSYPASPGIQAVRASVRGRLRPASGVVSFRLQDQQDYYSASLLLLSQLAVEHSP